MIRDGFIKGGAEFLNITEDEFRENMEDVTEEALKDWNNKKDINDFYKNTLAYVYGLVAFNDDYRITNILHPFVGMKNKTVLDYGGGIGILGMLLTSDNMVYYYDLDSKTKDFAKFMNTKLKNKITFIDDETKIFENPIDVVICVDVLEHLVNPMKLIKTITENLPKRGLFLTTGLDFSSSEKNPMHLRENYNYRKEYFEYMDKNYNVVFFHPTKNETIYLYLKK